MPYTILLKRNATPGVVPTPASLSLGELALNTGDGLLYYLDGSGSYSGTVRAINADSASFVSTSSYALTAQTLLGSVESASYAATASLLLGSIESASYALTASFALNAGGSGVTGGQANRLAVYTSATAVSSSRLIASGTEFLALNIREFVVSGSSPLIVAETPIDVGYVGFLARETFTPNNFGAFFGYDANNNRIVVGSQNGSTGIIDTIRFLRGSNNIEIVGSGTLIRGVQYVWPTANGPTGSVLAQNGSGVLGWVTSILSASFSTSSSYASVANTLLGSVESASYAATASLLLGSIESASYALTASFAQTALSASYAPGSPSISASYAETASFAVSASWAPSTGGGTPIAVDDEDVEVTGALTRLNFTGAGITATLSGSTVNVSVPGGGGSLARSIISTITPNISPGDSLTGSLAIGKSFILFQVSVDTDSRVRLYGSSSYQIADLGRAIGTDPTGSEPGIIVDLVLSGSPSLYEFTLSPVVNGNNVDPLDSSTIYYTVTNLSPSVTPVSMSFNRLVLE